MNIPRKILIVDDQESIHDAFRNVLAAPSPSAAELDALESLLFETPKTDDVHTIEFELEFAHQGQEGLQLVKQACANGTPFGLAFIDMRMPPGWDGVETIQNLWQVDPELQIVVCTAYSEHVWKDVCKKLGKIDQLLLLNKPFSSEYVLSLACALTEKRAFLEKIKVELAKSRETNKRLEQEIACRKDAERTLLEMATKDTLTGLPNRALLQRVLREFNHRFDSIPDQTGAMLFLDIDNFKLVNDSLGHKAGDELLTRIARRLEDHFDTHFSDNQSMSVTACRLGGDEFVVFLDGVASLKHATGIAKSINEILCPSFAIQERQVSISASIGIAMIDAKVLDEDEIMRKADTAMYRAKSGGKNRHAVFDDAMHKQALDQLEIELGLRTALERNEFEMHYQPIVALEHQRTVGFEALVRWRNSEGKLIPPDRFISVAEETGLIVPMGMWIANRACQDFAIWKKSFDDTDDCSISINVSKLQLLESTFLQDLTRICDDAGLEPRHVNIEITETAVTNSPDQIICTLLELREKGFSIHMDDFGTGQSSLSFLHRFPIDVLKIDRSFVAAMVDNSENATIIEAIITLAQNLGKEITAEGIETESQMNRLIDMNCEYGQGYFFAKPGPADIALNKRGEGVPSKHLRGRTIAMQSDL